MRNMHRQVFILAGSKAVFQTLTILLMTIGGLAGLYLALAPAWLTMPLAAASLGTALIMFPASTSAAMVLHSFWLLCFAMLPLGVYQAFAQLYRFAADEMASASFRTRAISFVIAGGVVAAFGNQ